MILFYDSETTGLPKYGSPSDDPEQPHLVQLAACLVEPITREVVSSMNVIIRPEGWAIPPEVVSIHGITTERAMAVGIPESLALEMFLALWGHRMRIGYNEQFDARLIRIALHRYKTEVALEDWAKGPAQCAMKLAHPHTKLLKNKVPKLTEAYKHFTGTELVGVHDAMVDTLACAKVFFAAQDLTNGGTR